VNEPGRDLVLRAALRDSCGFEFRVCGLGFRVFGVQDRPSPAADTQRPVVRTAVWHAQPPAWWPCALQTAPPSPSSPAGVPKKISFLQPQIRRSSRRHPSRFENASAIGAASGRLQMGGAAEPTSGHPRARRCDTRLASASTL